MVSSTPQGLVVGVDIGGSHVTAAAIDPLGPQIVEPSRVREPVKSSGRAGEILDAWRAAIGRAVNTAGVERVAGVGIAMPGPFDYSRGISAIRGLNKFDALFGVNVRQALASATFGQVVFRNDAECFALGEAWMGAGRGASRVVAITLGTGLGSAFVRDGAAVTSGPDVPENGWLYCVQFEGSAAEERFSARGLLRQFSEISSVEELAARARGDARAVATFHAFGRDLGRFLAPWLRRFNAQRLVVGGSIAKSWPLFSGALIEQLPGIDSRSAELFEDAALVGAARVATAQQEERAPSRQSRQKLMPLLKPPVAPDQYDLYPAHDIGPEKIEAGFDSLAEALAGKKLITIDGYVGAFFDDFRERLDAALRKEGVVALWFESRVALKPASEIDRLIGPFLGGDDPLFGTRFTGSLDDFFDAGEFATIKPDDDAPLCILIGPGAALANWRGSIVYLDVPKNEIQFRSRAGSVTNLGADKPLSPKEMYKRFYFVDWPALNEHKRGLLPRIDYLVDAQRPDEPAWMRGNDLRAALERLSTNVLRVRPWFEPGPWGGQWMKEHFADLPQDVPNYAWSFELIVPENGLIFASNGHMLEVSFDMLMFAHHQRVIGESSRFFGHEFPIRFDYLDTVRGGNLSVQCHPRPAYIRKQFGERFTQDETYYIHHAEPDARVYLGFRDNIDPAEFRAALERSADEGVPVDIDRYVASWPAKKHDLFLIPNGTIHCSGIGNLVLEISATPYIFTFKMYDWMRMDLEGKPRSLNIARAFENLYFDRRGQRVREEFISRAREAASGPDWKVVHLPTHPEHFYDVMRYEFEHRIDVQADGSCHVGNLVDGDHITVQTRDTSMRIAHAETFVIPAAADRYTLVNEAGGVAKVVVAFVKRDWRNSGSLRELQPRVG